MTNNSKDTVFVTGATGFVGRSLVPWLRYKGYDVVCGSRNPESARDRFPEPNWRRIDLSEPETITPALDGCSGAFYLVHSMASGPGYKEREKAAARAFAEGAADAGVEHIIYLGGVAPADGDPSEHLASRLQTGKILRESDVPTTELRASMVIGPGGESWKIVRDLAARLPVMVLPRWCQSETQPIFIDDVVIGLELALRDGADVSEVWDLPGKDTLSVEQIFRETANVMGHAPKGIRVPLLTPTLSSYWLKFVTGANYYLARQLVEGLKTDLLARPDRTFWNRYESFSPTSYRDAVRLTLDRPNEQLSLPTKVYEEFVRRIGRQP